MSKTKRFILPLLIISMLAVQMMNPFAALADGEPPPESPPATQVPPEGDETPPGETLIETEEPLSDETLPTEETAEANTTPAEGETPTADDTTYEEILAEAPTEADLSVAEALEQAPPDTGIVVVNDEGEAEPLATEEAAEIVAAADPLWCPDGQAPTPSANGCSPAFTYAGTATPLTDLISWLTANDPNQAGTIWIEDAYDSAAEGVAGFTLDGASFTNLDNHNLTVQGGWGGASGSTTITGTSSFTGDYLHVDNWNANVTLNDLVVDSASGNGVQVTTSGDISVKNVDSSNNTGKGAQLWNSGGINTGKITLNGTNTFNNNGNIGLDAKSNQDITLHNVTASDNTSSHGAFLDNLIVGSGTGDITMTGTSVFNKNGGQGLRVLSKGNIALENVTAGLDASTGNGSDGVYLDNTFGAGYIKITGTNVYYGNSGYGLDITSTGNIMLNNITASENGFHGTQLYNGGAGGQANNSITLTGTNKFNNNDRSGLEANSNGNITLNNITASYNGSAISLYDGVYLRSNGGKIKLLGTNAFIGNGEFGMEANTPGDITLNNLTVSGSLSYDGIYLGSIGTVTINCSAFNSNNLFGIDATGLSGSLTLNAVTFDGLNGSGDFNFGGTATVNPNYKCNPGGSTKVVSFPSEPVNTIPVTGGELVPLDCDTNRGTLLSLPNGDFADFPCPIQDSASLARVGVEDLPADPPDGNNYQSGFTTTVVQNGNPKEKLEKFMTVSFLIPAGMDPASLAVLYWDGAGWVELSNDRDLGAGKKVGLGGFLGEGGAHFQATVDFTGSFVLVSK